MFEALSLLQLHRSYPRLVTCLSMSMVVKEKRNIRLKWLLSWRVARRRISVEVPHPSNGHFIKPEPLLCSIESREHSHAELLSFRRDV